MGGHGNRLALSPEFEAALRLLALMKAVENAGGKR